ncbi:trafficking protein particle complex subunit 8 isoform X2 [Agrilus planipennis]|uniref:Trafficking protein particle complex subunit 8 isoform X2 n=1 Tax=Agrilus planipennis TaxID=224129 RepID=A0A7F5RN26_AGRPL|nr:trafficking protein particle complex subunit 8 isoform X2 [Agrilus planipennis]
MAQSKHTPQEYIKNAFKPQVGALCSSAAAQICRKNNLSFTEMIQPFCRLGSDVFYKDFSGQIVTVHNLEITVQDVNFQPINQTLARKLLNASVSHASEPRSHQIRINEYVLNVPNTAPWFEEWRDTFLQMQYPSDHEFTKHYLSCFFIMSSSDNLNDTINELNQLLKVNQNEKPKYIPKWFFQEVLKYYVIIHDNFDGDSANVSKELEYLKETYGVSNCFLLRMNSRPPGQINEQLPDPWSQFLTSKIKYPVKNNVVDSSVITHVKESLQESDKIENRLPYHPLSPDTDDKTSDGNTSDEQDSTIVHGCCLSPEDVEQIKLLIHEFCTRALVPYVERKINQLQQVFVNKSLTSSTFLSDPRKWFKSTKPSKSNTATDVFIYKPDSPELLMRKLGDLCFMFGNYSGAMQAYSYSRNDFLRDGALLYYAGAVEMYILSAFLASEPPRKVFRDMEESIRTYLDTCKMPQFATRATLLIFECLKGHNLYGEAAHQLIRMTSEDSDLRSALLLEQAAYCFLNAVPKLVRKYAFHMVLSGHRFSKALQKKHALRCYNQALQVFKKRGWNLAEDHIYLTIGKLATALNLLEEASEVFSLLNIESKQSPQQQAIFLREFLVIRNSLLKKENKNRAEDLPLPLLDCDNIKILVGPAPPLSIPGRTPALGITFSSCYDQETSQKWTKLEEMVVQEARGSLPLLFKPLVTLYTKSNIGSVEAVAIMGEPIQISIKLTNLLDIVLYLKDIHLHWIFYGDDDTEITNSNPSTNPDNFVKTFVIKACTLQMKSSEDLILSVIPFSVGKIVFKGVAFSLCNSLVPEEGITLLGEQRIIMKDRSLNKKGNDEQKFEKEIKIRIVPSAPCLQVSFLEINTEMLCDELQKIPMEIKNVGNSSIDKIYMATSTPQLISISEFNNKPWSNRESDLKTPAAREKELRRLCVTQLPLQGDKLDPGQSKSFNIWIKAPSEKGTINIDILIYYENLSNSNMPKYRLVRHTWMLNTQETLSAKVLCQGSFSSKSVEQLSLSAKITNLNKFHDLKIINVSLVKVLLLSSDWLLLKDLELPKTLRITSEQSIHLLLKARRNSKREEIYSEIILDPETFRPLLSNSVCLDLAIKNFEQHVSFLDEFVSQDAGRKIHSPNQLVLQWKASVSDSSGQKKNIIGQTTTPLSFKDECDIETSLSYEVNQTLDLTVSITKSNVSVETKKNQVFLSLLHPISIRHDFKNKKFCTIPVQIVLHNVVDAEMVVTVNTLGSSSDSPPLSFRPNFYYQYPSKYFRWIGKSSAVKSLMPFSSEILSMHVAVFGPGTYDLGSRLETWCHEKDNPDNMVLQNYRAESALIVLNGST